MSGTCVANIPEIQALCRHTFKDFFDPHGDNKFKVPRSSSLRDDDNSKLPYLQYKIELRVRNHTTIPRQILIQHVAQCVPDGHTVDLDNPQIFILVEVFKASQIHHGLFDTLIKTNSG